MAQTGDGYGDSMDLDRRVQPLVLAAIVAAIQVGGSIGAAEGQPDRLAIDGVGVVLLVAGPLSLVVWRRWAAVPVVTSVATACTFIGLGYPFGPVFASVAVAFFLAVQAVGRRLVLGLAAVSTAAFLTVASLDPRGHGFDWLHAIVVVGWMTALVAVSEIARGRREQLRERRDAEEAERERRLADERVRLAQELHDVLAHHISLINVQASVALHLIEGQPERAADALAHIKAASAEAIDELRTALDLLRGAPTPRSPAPRLADLHELAEGVRASGLIVELTVGGCAAELDASVPAAVELAAFRIVQEALTNVTRHSDAHRVAVRVDVSEASVDVDVVDDGHAASEVSAADTPRGRGVAGMWERATALGGHLEVGPTPTGGFHLNAHLPWGAS